MTAFASFRHIERSEIKNDDETQINVSTLKRVRVSRTKRKRK